MMNVRRSKWLTIVAVLVTMLLIPQFASAQGTSPPTLESALQNFVADSFGDTIKGIEAVTRTGSPRASEILEALGDRRLLLDAASKTLFVKDAAGTVREALTGKPVASLPAGLSTVRVNNRVRQTLQSSIGALTLLHPDPARRLQAAAALLKSRDISALPAVKAAIAAEKVEHIRKTFELAAAAIVVGRQATPLDQRLQAVQTLRDNASQDALSILKSLPADSAPPVRQAANLAISDIEDQLAIWGVVQNLWHGISLGSVLLLAAVGLAITFGVMGVINMAHGEMVMIGAYTTFVVQELVRAYAPGLIDYVFIAVIPLAFLVAGAIGVAMERGIIRHLYGRPLETLLATWGISLILQQAVRTAFGPTNREVATPSFMSGAFELGGMTVTWNRLYIVIFAALIFVGLLLTLRYTALGLHMRAVTQNRRMAASMGIPTDRVDALTFGLGSGIAGLAGVALSQIDNVSPNLGQSYIIDSFLVVVFGGVGNLWGTLVGAMSLGLANKILEPYAGAVLGKIVLLVAIILFIQKRPRGLFALKGRAVEA